MNNCLIKEFQNPGADKRSIPFWAWNGKMDEEELREQVRRMKQAGVGGFFIHSRIGLETDYLGAEWMNCVKAVVAEAKEQGLYAWLYDEDRWPSGTAGGRVTSAGDAYRCKGLTLEVCSVEAYEEIYANEIRGKEPFTDERSGLIAMYRAVLSDVTDVSETVNAEVKITAVKNVATERPMAIESYECLDLTEKASFAENEVLLVVRLAVSAPSEWFNNEAPPDNLNPDCTRRFIAETHEKYKEAVGEEFGKTVPGIFTDEPSLHDRHAFFGENKSWIPWTYGFGQYFKELTGYDFLEKLPLFYFHGENSTKVRHDYWRCVTQRYSESYYKVLGQWCQENNLLFTGHFLQEDKLGLCARVNGAVMPHYQYQHVPGIDMLCEQTGEYLTVKQCTSVANQLGKKQVISETYGCTGWEFTFEGQKWMGDWQYVLGVNRRCQHLMLYSLRGCRKRDYPPSFNYNTNWWDDNKIVDDYFARVSVVLEQGEAVRNLLLLHPSATAWSRLGVNPYGNPRRREERDTAGINALGDELNSLIEYLERQHLDCDLGDELLIKQFGRLDESNFVIGQAGYQAVVIPHMDTLLASTAEKLLTYLNQGGYVYALKPEPFMVDGESGKSELLGSLLAHKNWIAVDSREELAEKLAPYRTISITDGYGQECKDVLYQLRKCGNEYYLFLVNNNRNKKVNAVVQLPFKAEPMRMDLLTGEIEPETCYENTEAGLEISLHLEKTDSAAYCLKVTESETSSCDTAYAYRLTHKNVLPLDMCRYRMFEETTGKMGEWSEEQEIWQIQRKVRKHLEMIPNHNSEVEQRYKWIYKPHPKDGTRLELSYSFTADVKPGEVALALECPQDFEIILNGQRVSGEWTDWLLDKEIKMCKLPEVCQGENQLILSCGYRNDMELENIFLVGDFGVSIERHMTTLSETLKPGSWTEQGLKHYCGSVIYLLNYISEENPGKVCLKLPAIDAICVKVRVNEAETVLPWNFERSLSIEKWLQPGDNRIEVEVVGSPRNMMGPFHLEKKPVNTNDEAFCPPESRYAKEYLLAPYGIKGEIVIV